MPVECCGHAVPRRSMRTFGSPCLSSLVMLALPRAVEVLVQNRQDAAARTWQQLSLRHRWQPAGREALLRPSSRTANEHFRINPTPKLRASAVQRLPMGSRPFLPDTQ